MAKFVILVFVFAVLAIIATSIVSYGGVTNFMRAINLAFTKAGRLTIGAEAPTITWVHMDAPGSDTDCTTNPGDCATDPEENDYHDPELRVRVRDGNGHCNDVNFHVYIYLCNPGGALDCSGAGARPGMPVELSFDFQDPADNAYCEYIWPVGTNEMDYWETPANNYELYVTATDPGALSNSDDPVRTYWEYTSLPSWMYPMGDSDGYIDYGTVSLGIFNEGIGDAVENDVEAKNGGNAVTQVEWQAMDFNDGGTNYIDIDTSPAPDYPNYWLDDDQDHDDADATDFDQDYFRDTLDHVSYGAYFTWPSSTEGYVDICTDHTCSMVTNPTAHFNAYYHLFIPAGQAQGTYTNSIQINFGAAP